MNDPTPAAERGSVPDSAPSLGDTSSVAEAALPELLPARMLNEFTYCPRLGYLEWVQGEWAENIETLQGSFGHRNVDKPSRGSVPAPPIGEADSSSVREDQRKIGTVPADKDGGQTVGASDESDTQSHAANGETIHARSLMLSASREGLVAKMDLLELELEEGQAIATPVDYKRGTVPDVPEGAYEPERVQLCAQGLILRENGYDCREGVLYYIASRRRVVIPFDEALVARTREQIAEFRRMAAAGKLPPPLIDSPKCPRCSLVGICLPDETNLLRTVAERDEPWDGEPGDLELATAAQEKQPEHVEGWTPTGGLPRSRDGLRRLIPVRDDALPLYLQGQGLTLTKSGEQLVIKEKSATVRSVRLIDTSQVCLFGSIHVTEPALRELLTRGIPVCHFSYGGWFYAITTGLHHKNVELRIRQFATAADPALSLALARQFVIGKIKNCRTLLRRHLEQDDKDKILWQLNEYATKAGRADSAETLLGLEGTAAKVYFSGFARLLNGAPSFDMEGRNRRPPRDPINALLSFLYALLVKELTIAVQSVGFDPMLGVYHQPRYGRPSLALDLAEEFRPLIADSTALTLVNNGEVTESSFVRRAGAFALTDAGRKAVMGAFERRLATEITHPIFGYKASYRRILEVQARLLARSILGDLPEYPNFCTR